MLTSNSVVLAMGALRLASQASMSNRHLALVFIALTAINTIANTADITYARQFNLRPGIALSAAQVAQLTSDMVWLVEKDVTIPGVNGQPATVQKALVPQLYAAVREGDLSASGALLGGANVQIDAASMLNSGTIQGRKVLQINATTIDNILGDIQGRDVQLSATQDINNTGGPSAPSKTSAW